MVTELPSLSADTLSGSAPPASRHESIELHRMWHSEEGILLAKGKPGADSAAAVTSQIAGKSLIQLASELYGEAPVFWGRYFTSITQRGNVEYRHLKEDRPLRDKGIRVAPIARQTRRVQGTRADGSADAIRNAADYIATFGADYLASQGKSFFVFLDVEGAPSLSKEYYAGWAATLADYSSAMTKGSVKLVPCVYATQADNSTWAALAAAAASGVICGGAWIARWRFRGCHALEDWDPKAVNPRVPLPCPVLIWQYADDCHGGAGFDCSQTNPALDLEADLLAHLVLPPPSSGPYLERRLPT